LPLINNYVDFHPETPDEQNRLYEYNSKQIPSGQIDVKDANFYFDNKELFVDKMLLLELRFHMTILDNKSRSIDLSFAQPTKRLFLNIILKVYDTSHIMKLISQFIKNHHLNIAGRFLSSSI
jgi:hypothetical protein